MYYLWKNKICLNLHKIIVNNRRESAWKVAILWKSYKMPIKSSTNPYETSKAKKLIKII